MRELIGKTIRAIFVAPGEERLVFETDEGRIVYDVTSDCCSETWFSDILGVEALIGATVATAEEAVPDNYNVDDGRGRQESDEVYGWKLTTNFGHSDIIFRNSSNGFYGGSCYAVSDAVVIANVDTTAMVQIATDWKA